MSTSTLSGRQGIVLTNPKFIPATRGMTKWVNKMAERRDLTVRIIARTDGAPARFIQARACIDINEKMLEGIDPGLIGSQEFVALYPSKAGIVVHEAIGHAMNSYLINLDTIFKTYGPRHTEVFKCLEEGRCERQGWTHGTNVERYALQSAVLDIILADLAEETAEEEVAYSPGRLVLQTMGLVAARADAGILDMSMPKAQKVMKGLQIALDGFYPKLMDVAVEFSGCKVGTWHSDEKDMHNLVKKWIELEQEFLKEVEPEEPEGGTTVCTLPGTPTGKGKGGEEDGKETETGSEPGGDPSETPENKPGEGEGKGNQGQKEDQDADDTKPGNETGDDTKESEEEDTKPGLDDDGEPGDGSQVLTQDMMAEDIDNADLGTYAGGTSLEDVYREIVKEIQEASDEARKVSGHRLGVELKAIHKSSALEHADRRKRNAAAKKLWR